MKRYLPVLVLIALGVLVAARATFPARSAGSTPTLVSTPPTAGTRVTVLPQTVIRGDVITVIADGLPGPADQFCVYEGVYPLAHFVPPGYGEQISPLLPDGKGGEGISAYQIFQTEASKRGACPATQLRGNTILLGAGWAFGRWKLRMESEGQPTAGSGLAIRLDHLYNPRPISICVAAWTSGHYTGISRTYGANVVGGGATVRFPLPPSLVGTLTITGTRGNCPAGPPRHFDAFTPVVIAGPIGPSPTPTPLATPGGPTAPLSLPTCPALPTASNPPSPTSGDSRLVYSTYLGRGAVQGNAVALDGQGNAYVALMAAGAQEGCVVELSRDGSRILRSVTFPGMIEALAFDRSGDLWLTGSTSSETFPVVRPIQPAALSNPAFVAELNPADKLIFSTELGGRMGASGQAIAVDRQGSVYVTGQTDSTDFPTTKGALQPRSGSIVPCPSGTCPYTVSSSDAFITKLSSQGKIVYSTYLGGNENEDGQGIAVDAHGDAYVSGWTASNDFPTIHPLPHTQCPDPFLVELSPPGNRLLASTCLGAHFTVGLSGPLALVGKDVAVGGSSGVMKLDPAHSRIAWWLPFNRGIAQVSGLVADDRGTIYLTGSTVSAAVPLLHPIQRHFHHATCGQEDATHYRTDAFVAAVSSAGKLLFSTYLGGKADDAGQGISVQAGRIAVPGFTASEAFPVRLALQPKNEGEGGTDQYCGGKPDGFVTVLSVPGSAQRGR